MMPPSRRAGLPAVLFYVFAALLALLVLVPGAPARAAVRKFDVAVSSGAILAYLPVDRPSVEASDVYWPAVGVQTRWRWLQNGSALAGLGVRLDLFGAVVPYSGCGDEVAIGTNCVDEGWEGHYAGGVTLFPGALLDGSLDLNPAVDLDLSLGLRHIVSEPMGRWGIFPIPAAGAGVSLRLAEVQGGHLWLRASYDVLWIGVYSTLREGESDGTSLQALQLALAWSPL